MKINKKGFTLGEVLVCIMIIGIIMALSMQSIKMVKTSYTSLTYFAFKTVQDLVGEVYAGENPSDKLLDVNGKVIDSTVSYCKEVNEDVVDGKETMVENGAISVILKPDKPPVGLLACNKLNTNAGSSKNTFCNALVALANTAGNVDCTNFNTVQFSAEKKEPYIHINDYKKPNFIATNGMRYYLTSWTFDANVSKQYGFRLLAVDLNGETKPNLYEAATNSKLPDIVTFMIMDNAEVIPLGVAADNVKTVDDRTIRYLNSKVKGYYYAYNPDRKENVPADCTYKKSGKSVNTCNYAVVNVRNEEGESIDVDGESVKGTFFTYRQAYCGAIGSKNKMLTNYCKGIDPLELCPPSSSDKRFDLCVVENVKPMFRYNLK